MSASGLLGRGGGGQGVEGERESVCAMKEVRVRSWLQEDAADQLSLGTTATEPTLELQKPKCLEPVVPSKRRHHSEKPRHHNKQ